MPEISDDEYTRLKTFETQNQQLKSQVTQLQDQVTQLTPLQQQVTSLTSERDTYKTQAETLGTQNQSLRLGAAFDSALNAAGVLPQYRDRFADQITQLKLDGDTVLTQDGKPLTEFAAGLKTQYPALFAAENNPTGSGTQPTIPTTPASTSVISGTDAKAVSGLNPQDVIGGKVQVTL
ncbi:MAG: hypothetical protein KME16_26810 [Scytolyngbya sp. HA4215-MV1]|nr:hypothetical protein [Scytolyngbya sp. HA4215-MV1]